jgi:hypothetical protein
MIVSEEGPDDAEVAADRIRERIAESELRYAPQRAEARATGVGR